MKESPIKAGINAFKKSFVKNYASYMDLTPEAAVANLNEIKNTLIGIGLIAVGFMSIGFPAITLGVGVGAGIYFHKAYEFNLQKLALMRSARSTSR